MATFAGDGSFASAAPKRHVTVAQRNHEIRRDIQCLLLVSPEADNLLRRYQHMRSRNQPAAAGDFGSGPQTLDVTSYLMVALRYGYVPLGRSAGE